MVSDVIWDNEMCRPALPVGPKVESAPGPGIASDNNKRTENIKPKLFHANPVALTFLRLLLAVSGADQASWSSK